MMNLRTKYSTALYEDLCFKHAIQEVMHGEDVEEEIIPFTPKDEHDFIVSCALCAMVEAEQENRLTEWYRKYKENK